MGESESTSNQLSSHERKKQEKLARIAERADQKRREQVMHSTRQFDSLFRKVFEAVMQCHRALNSASQTGGLLARQVDMKTVQFKQACRDCRAILNAHRNDWNVWGPTLLDVLKVNGSMTIVRAESAISRAEDIYSRYKDAESRELSSGPPIPIITAEQRRERAKKSADRQRKSKLGLKEVVPGRIVLLHDNSQGHISKVYIIRPHARASTEQAGTSLPGDVRVIRYESDLAHNLLGKWTKETIKFVGGSRNELTIQNVLTIAEAMPAPLFVQVGHGLADHYENGGAVFNGGWP